MKTQKKIEGATLKDRYFLGKILTPNAYSQTLKGKTSKKNTSLETPSYPSKETSSSFNFVIPSEASQKILDHLNEMYEKFGDNFYKFSKPCKNPHYHPGESWAELFGYNYRKHLQEVCQIYEVSKKFRSLSDPFQGKYYACCALKIRGVNFTIYRKNPNYNREI